MRLSTSPAPGPSRPRSAATAAPACPPWEAGSARSGAARPTTSRRLTPPTESALGWGKPTRSRRRRPRRAGSPVTTLATESIVLDFADERSFVQTRFATSVLVLLRAHLGDDITPLAAAAEAAIAADLPANPADFDHFVFVGTGPGAHLASEAALKMRETGGAWTEAYPAMELRHGPMSALSPRSLVWSLGAAPEGLGDEVARTGATWLESAADPLVALVRGQRLAVANALAKGLDPDHPRFLSRAVILPGSA